MRVDQSRLHDYPAVSEIEIVSLANDLPRSISRSNLD